MLLPLVLNVGFFIDPCCNSVTIGFLKPWNNLADWWQVINPFAKWVFLHIDDPKMCSLIYISSPITRKQNEVGKNAIFINMHDIIFRVWSVFAGIEIVKYLWSFDKHTHLCSCYRLNIWNKSLSFLIFFSLYFIPAPNNMFINRIMFILRSFVQANKRQRQNEYS